MAPQPISYSNFGGGLDLASQPGLVSFDKALDCLNVRFTSRGAVQQRGGYAAFTNTLTNQPDSLGVFSKSDGTKRLLVGNANRIDVLDTGGGSVANTTVPTASPHFFARFGGPTIEAIYIANGTDQVRRYDTSGGFTTPAGLSGQTGKFVVVSPVGNRLLVARESGSTLGNNPSSVNASVAGDPEDFTVANGAFAQDFDPGDGEPIMGMVNWGNATYVFKQSKLFLITGEISDQTGAAEFQYRKVDTGVGLSASRAVASSPEGVYFLHTTGIYRAAGDSVTRISAPIDPFFEGDPSIYFRSNPINHGSIDKAAMCYHDNRLYVAVPTGGSTTNDRMLVYDPRDDWWSLYDIPAAAMVSFAVTDQRELVFARATTSKTVARHKTGNIVFSADDMTTSGTGGIAITSRWRSGWTNHGTELEKTVDSIELYGTGTTTVRSWVDYQYTNDFDGHPLSLAFTGAGATYTGGFLYDDGEVYGPTAVVSRKLHAKGYSGTTFSLDCQNLTINVSWALNVATYFVNSSSPPGIKG